MIRTLALIETLPEVHYQHAWRCGSGMCFAGWVATLAGGKWQADPTSPLLEAEPEDDKSYVLDRHDGRFVSAEYRATRLLGITEPEADELFYPDNTRDDLRTMVEEFCGPVGFPRADDATVAFAKEVVSDIRVSIAERRYHA